MIAIKGADPNPSVGCLAGFMAYPHLDEKPDAAEREIDGKRSTNRD